MTDRKEELLNLSAAQFAAWETHLFLDTHKHNTEALKKLNKFNRQAREQKQAFEAKYGALTPSDIYGETKFEWVNNPWPWERSANA